MRREVYLWMATAREDLKDAGDALERDRWFRTAFFSHQAVEKALRALFFIVRREDPPKIHTVTELYWLLKEEGFVLPEGLEKQIYMFNKYYTVTRYPDAANGLPHESIDQIEGERCFETAKRIVDHIEARIGESDEDSG